MWGTKKTYWSQNNVGSRTGKYNLTTNTCVMKTNGEILTRRKMKLLESHTAKSERTKGLCKFKMELGEGGFTRYDFLQLSGVGLKTQELLKSRPKTCSSFPTWFKGRSKTNHSNARIKHLETNSSLLNERQWFQSTMNTEGNWALFPCSPMQEARENVF